MLATAVMIMEPSMMEERKKTTNLRLTLAVGQILEQNGVPVSYTRQSDIYQSPSEKARLGNERGADYFISFHRNASPNAE